MNGGRYLIFIQRLTSNESKDIKEVKYLNIDEHIRTIRLSVCTVNRLTREEVPVAVGFILALLAVGHGRHLLGRGAAHLLLLSCSPPHP